MGPEIALDADALRHNARVLRERADGAALRAVIKADGYGWGRARLVAALDDLVDGYYVADADEFDAARSLTGAPLVTLATASERVGAILERGGIPTIASADALAAVGAWRARSHAAARVRLALRGALGWAGVDATELVPYARALARDGVEIELSSHVTDPALYDEQRREFEAARAALVSAGVEPVACDLSSSQPLVTRGRTEAETQVRVGAALFGARFAARIALRSALRVRARVVEVAEAAGQRAGYGLGRAPRGGFVATVRCGYADGYPPAVDARVRSVGMQYVTIACDAPPASTIALVDETTDLDALAERAGIGVHRLITALGCGARANDAVSDAF